MKAVRILPIAMLAFVFGAAAGEGPGEQRPEQVLLQGKVVDARNGQPLEGVRVILREPRPLSLVGDETTSNRDGEFSLAVPLPGSYVLGTELLGYGQLGIHVVLLDASLPVGPRTRLGVRESDVTYGDPAPIRLEAGGRYEILVEMEDTLIRDPRGRGRD